MAKLVDRCYILDHIETQVQLAQCCNSANAINVFDQIVRSENTLQVDQVVKTKIFVTIRLVLFKNFDILVP